MAHAPSRGCGTAGNEAHHGLLAPPLGLVHEELRRVFLGGSPDLADHDNRLGRFVGKKHFQHGDKVGALDRVAAYANRGGLAKALLRGLKNGFVSEGARARYDADRARLEDAARHDPDLALARRHHPRAIRSDQSRFRTAQSPLDPHHVDHRDAFGDAHDEGYFRLDSLRNSVGRPGWRHIDDARIATRSFARLPTGVEDRQHQPGQSALARRCPADHAGAIIYRGLRMKGAVLAGKALADDLGAAVDQNRHHTAPRTAVTIFWAASSRSFADVTLRLSVHIISFPFSTLFPPTRPTPTT